MSSESNMPEDKIRRIAREEAKKVNDIEVEGGDGEGWNLRKLMDQFEISRRTALAALGLISVGYHAPRAVLQVISRDAAAAPDDDLTVPGTLTAGSVDTERLGINPTGKVLSTTETVSTSTTAINFGERPDGIVAVYGEDDGSSAAFVDAILCLQPGTSDPLTFGSREFDSPSSRSYENPSTSGFGVSVSSGTYSIKAMLVSPF